MTADELREIIRLPEGLKLDFKREYHLDKHSVPPDTTDQDWNNYVDGQWAELTKDIIAITNGNIGTSNEIGRLIIGVGDQILADGSRALFDSRYLQLSSQQIMAKINSMCEPAIPDIAFEQIDLDGKIVSIISVPPSPYLHESSRDLRPTKGNFNTAGTLVNSSVKQPYTRYTAFLRKGEDVYPASNIERRTLEEDKKFQRLLVNEGVRQELVNNLQALLYKNPKNGDIIDIVALWENFKSIYKIKLMQDLHVEREHIGRFLMPLMTASGAVTHLQTQFIDSAVTSGKYLDFDVTQGKYERSLFLTQMVQLQERIYRLKKNSDTISEIIVANSPKLQPGELIKVEATQAVVGASILNFYSDIVALSRSLLRHLSDEKESLEPIQLTNPVVDETEQETMQRESISEDEVVYWALGN